ncbi:sushi domain-containing protein 2-like [Apostichopus japonicus]|uniref:sushi domain-containing protein 2-like n=1 Tax=Stichopus japonicus TaxID=307972 RepID=UPI003AB5EAF5
MMRFTLINLALCLSIVYAQDENSSSPVCRGNSRGREFVVGFTNNFRGSSWIGEVHILVVAFNEDLTTVNISSRREVEGGKYEVNFELAAREYRRITIPRDFLLEFISGRSDKVLIVNASSDVSVYGMNYARYTTDGFLAIPNEELGMSYVVASVMTLQTAIAASLLSVVGVEDGTNVDITIAESASFENQDYSPGDIISFQLDSHEIIQVLGAMGTDLTGSIIRSNRPVAAYGGHSCANTLGTTCDTLSEQLIPVDSWGSRHIYTQTGSSIDVSIYRIVSFFGDTVVSVPGLENRTLNAGEFWEVSLAGNGVISSSLPISVTQILRSIDGGNVDPSIIQVPAEEQFAFKFGFVTPPNSTEDTRGFLNFVNIVVRHDECNTVLFNGSPIECSTSVVDIPGTEYVMFRQELQRGEGVYFIEQGDSSSTSRMSVIVYGYERKESYGYAAGLSLPSEGRILSAKPFLVRENGGDVITTTLPCQQPKVEEEKIICRFRQNASEVVRKGFLEDFDRVICPTSVFSNTGFTTIDISLDGGETYPYIDTVYVVSQYMVLPKVSVMNVTVDFGLIDLSEKREFFLVWDPDDFYNAPYVDISVIVANDNEDIGWSREIPLKQIPNEGVHRVKETDINFSINTLSNLIFQVKSVYKQMIVEPLKEHIVRTSFQVQLAFVNTSKLDCSTILESASPLPALPPCPCTLAQARVDSRYKESNAAIDIFHPGAVACYGRNAEDSQAGQQCCYGNNNGQLLRGPPGGGTADAYAPDRSASKHIKYDVLPWIACCYRREKTNDCLKYYQFRPSDDCTRYEPPRPAIGIGDPHFITLDQAKYTFNAVGEFTLLETRLHNITLQGRMEQVPGFNASVFSAFAVRGENLPVIQVQRSLLNQTLILIDGKELMDDYQGKFVPSFTFGEAQVNFNPDKSNLTIALSFGFTITITISRNMMSYIVYLEDKFKGNINGLLGNFNDDPTDDLMLPNSTVLALDSSMESIHHNFGLKWMVDTSNTIFTYFASANNKFYTKPEFTPNFDFPESSRVSQDIQNLCGDNLPCLFDAVNTGSLEFANETRMSMSDYQERKKVFDKVVTCEFPNDFINGQLNETVYYVNSTYQSICEPGFFLFGSDLVKCEDNGKWGTELPLCVNNWLVIGLPVGAVCSLVLLLLTCAIYAKRMCSSSKQIV